MHFESEADYQAYCQAEAEGEAQAQAEAEAGEYEYLQTMLDAKEYWPWALHMCWRVLEKPHPEAARFLMEEQRRYFDLRNKEDEKLKALKSKPDSVDDNLPF